MQLNAYKLIEIAPIAGVSYATVKKKKSELVSVSFNLGKKKKITRYLDFNDSKRIKETFED